VRPGDLLIKSELPGLTNVALQLKQHFIVMP
jgi:hypothetical protein